MPDDVAFAPTSSTRYLIGHTPDGTPKTYRCASVAWTAGKVTLPSFPTSSTRFMPGAPRSAIIAWATRSGRRIFRPVYAGRASRSRRTRSSSRGSPARLGDDPPPPPDVVPAALA